MPFKYKGTTYGLPRAAYERPLLRIRMPPQDRECPIDLLRHHHPRKLVRQCHRRKRQQHVRLFAPAVRITAGAPDREHQIASLLFRLRHKTRKLPRVELLTVRVEQDARSRWMP